MIPSIVNETAKGRWILWSWSAVVVTTWVRQDKRMRPTGPVVGNAQIAAIGLPLPRPSVRPHAAPHSSWRKGREPYQILGTADLLRTCLPIRVDRKNYWLAGQLVGPRIPTTGQPEKQRRLTFPQKLHSSKLESGCSRLSVVGRELPERESSCFALMTRRRLLPLSG
jgi:hypothetical protein